MNLLDCNPVLAQPTRPTAPAHHQHRSITWVFYSALLLILVGAECMGLAATAFQQAPASNTSASSAPQTQMEPGAPRDPALSQAWTLLQQKKVSEAEISIKQYLAEHPRSAEGHFLLGFTLFRKIQADAVAMQGVKEASGASAPNLLKLRIENAKASLAEYTEGAKYHDPSAFDLKVVALDYILLKDYSDADKWLTRSVQRNSGDAEAWYYLGRTKYNENRFEEAIQTFEQFLKLEPRSVKGEDNLGLAYQGLGRTADAIAAYKQAIAWQPDNVEADSDPFINLGAILLDQNEAGEAVPYLLKAVAISPEESRAHEQLGKAYDRLGELPKAQEEMERSVKLAPQDARLHYMLGQLYRKEGLKDKATTEFDRSSALRSDSRSAPSDR